MNHLTVGDDQLDYDKTCKYCGEPIHFTSNGFCDINCKIAYYND